MNRITTSAAAFCLVLCARGFAEPDATKTGPETEKRFPPLVVPEGFRATLFACDPLVEYPSVIALGPRQGTLFVAHDYMTGLGTEIVRRDEVRLLEDTDSDQYADRSTVYAGGFNSIQGLAFHAGTVYVMHAPLLTALRDPTGDGVADERKDLLGGLGLPPEDNPPRLHCANGVTVGHDGWLYLSLGDHGCKVKRPEGDELVFNGGGILRCRPDGRDLHLFSIGLRNIYDVALDGQLNVFVRDNENDGGTYMIRVAHCFHGSDHGYPYLYTDRPDELMTPMADLGRGSSAGGVCYLETAFPAEMHGDLFFCEWGRAVVRYDRQRSQSGFAPTKEIDFAAGAPNDPYGFKPTDLVVDRDGSLLISDWCDGQRPKRGRGRIYRVSVAKAEPTPAPPINSVTTALQSLDSASSHVRLEAQDFIERKGSEALAEVNRAWKENRLGALGRTHAVWIRARMAGAEAIEDLLRAAESDPEPAVQAQAVRAIADLTDPILVQHRLDARGTDANVAERLASNPNAKHPEVLFELVTALGRLRWDQTPSWLRDHVANPDAALAHAAMQSLRRARNWSETLKLLDLPDGPIRSIALRAVAEQWEPIVVDGLIGRLGNENNSDRRAQYADLLSRVYKRPAPWVYWGYRPAPRPANTVEWERTTAIAEVLDRVLKDRDLAVRSKTLARLQREQIPIPVATLSSWLTSDRDRERVGAILDVLKTHPFAETNGPLKEVIAKAEYHEANRLTAAANWLAGKTTDAELLDLAKAVPDGPVLEPLLTELGARSAAGGMELLLEKLGSSHARVRAAATEALARRNAKEAIPSLPGLLEDGDEQVRLAAIRAAGRLGATDNANRILALSTPASPIVRAACLDALRQLGNSQAVPSALDSLDHAATLRSAIDYLSEFGDPTHAERFIRSVAKTRNQDILLAAVSGLVNWDRRLSTESADRASLRRAMARIQGDSGVILCSILDLTESATAAIPEPTGPPVPGRPLTLARDADGVFMANRSKDASTGSNWIAYSMVEIEAETSVEFLFWSNSGAKVWLNNELAHERQKPAPSQTEHDRFEGKLKAGANQLALLLPATEETTRFRIRFRRRGSSAEHERLIQHALKNTGNMDRGRELFQNAEKSLCVKCHQLGGAGGKIGPDLTGIGGRFSRIHLIESILEPSRSIAPSYESVAVALTDGQVLSGVKVTEDAKTLSLGDEQGRTHTIEVAQIESRSASTRSTMPEGLEKRLTDQELIDLLTFLGSQKDKR